MAPKRYVCLEPRRVPLFGISVFADVIKDLGLGWALDPIIHPYKKREGKQIQRRREEGHVKM